MRWRPHALTPDWVRKRKALHRVKTRLEALLNPETRQPLINVANVLADARWVADVPARAANRLANRVGWFDLNNINCGLLGMPLGFLVMIVVSLMTKEPSREMQALIDEIRKPRGRTVLEEKA
jgi:cation/acetate symporter